MQVQTQNEHTSFRSQAGELLTLAAPMIGVTISRMLITFVDFVMVSKLGTTAQAAISPCSMLLFTIACLGMGMSQGVQTFVSQAIGRGEPQRAGAYVWQTIYLALAAASVTAPIAAAVGIWFPYVGAAGSHPPDVLQQEIAFLQYALWSIGPMTATAGLESFYNGIRRPTICLWAVLVSLVTIAVANYALIFGHFGAPRMGIAGSGLATLLAWLARLGVLAIPLLSQSIDTLYQTRRSFAPDLARIREIINVGGPIAMQWLIDIGSWFVFLEILMPPFGEIPMAGANLAIQYMHLSFMPAVGIGMALTTQVGNAVGARQFDQALQRVLVARRLIVLYMSFMGVVFIALGRPLAALLTSEEDAAKQAQVVSAAASMLVWVALFQLSDALCIVYSFAFRGAGDTRVPAMLFAICCWGIFVTGGFAVTRWLPQYGYQGLWATCTLYIVVLSILLWIRFRSGAWRKMGIFDRAESQAGTDIPVGA